VGESAEQRSRTMRAVKNRDTAPEILVRKLLFSLGYRYRLHGKNLPGKPDLVFPARRKAVFVHGCFWHGHRCQRGNRVPKTNQDYWVSKIERNKVRDETVLAQLRGLGWDTLVVWECELKDRPALTKTLEDFLRLGERSRHT
jgi:DNA mismatch endonuclease (patch repair protein)